MASAKKGACYACGNVLDCVGANADSMQAATTNRLTDEARRDIE
jgi:hypothetical protein